MRRIICLLAVLMMVLSLSVGASAATNASEIHVTAIVASDGTAQVTQVVSFHLEQAVEGFRYPLPANARDVAVNGNSVRVTRDQDAAYVDMNRFFGYATGNFTATFSYTLDDLVGYNEDKLLMLELPIVWGFSFPVEALEFTITLPGDIQNRPAFSSGYFKTRIEENMLVEVNSNIIEGSVLAPLKDRETLTLELKVDEKMFPPSVRAVWSAGADDKAIAVCAVLALVYWIVFLRCLPPRRIRRGTPPDAIGAGEIGAAMVMAGPDLTMMVVSWAQMGYMLIQLDNNGRVLLHKRMEMGNERSNFERNVFRLLFSRRNIVDGTGLHYAKLCRKVAASKPNLQGIYQRKSGNPMIFRLLALAAAPFGGLSLALSMMLDGFLGALVTVVMVLFGLISGWFIQAGGKCFHLRDKGPLYVAAILCGVWLVLGIIAGEPVIAALVAGGELLAGVMAAYGGRRTELGKQLQQQIYGLRHELKHPDRAVLLRIMSRNPAYYYTLAPYALAFGVDKVFAKGFGGMRLSGCPYLTTGMDGHLTASDWSKLLRRAVHILDQRQKRLPLEQLLRR